MSQKREEHPKKIGILAKSPITPFRLKRRAVIFCYHSNAGNICVFRAESGKQPGKGRGPPAKQRPGKKKQTAPGTLRFVCVIRLLPFTPGASSRGSAPPLPGPPLCFSFPGGRRSATGNREPPGHGKRARWDVRARFPHGGIPTNRREGVGKNVS